MAVAFDFFWQVVVNVFEEVFSWFGIEDTSVVTNYKSVSQLGVNREYHIFSDGIRNILNENKDLTVNHLIDLELYQNVPFKVRRYLKYCAKNLPNALPSAGIEKVLTDDDKTQLKNYIHDNSILVFPNDINSIKLTKKKRISLSVPIMMCDKYARLTGLAVIEKIGGASWFYMQNYTLQGNQVIPYANPPTQVLYNGNTYAVQREVFGAEFLLNYDYNYDAANSKWTVSPRFPEIFFGYLDTPIEEERTENYLIQDTFTPFQMDTFYDDLDYISAEYLCIEYTIIKEIKGGDKYLNYSNGQIATYVSYLLIPFTDNMNTGYSVLDNFEPPTSHDNFFPILPLYQDKISILSMLTDSNPLVVQTAKRYKKALRIIDIDLADIVNGMLSAEYIDKQIAKAKTQAEIDNLNNQKNAIPDITNIFLLFGFKFDKYTEVVSNGLYWVFKSLTSDIQEDLEYVFSTGSEYNVRMKVDRIEAAHLINVSIDGGLTVIGQLKRKHYHIVDKDAKTLTIYKFLYLQHSIYDEYHVDRVIITNPQIKQLIIGNPDKNNNNTYFLEYNLKDNPEVFYIPMNYPWMKESISLFDITQAFNDTFLMETVFSHTTYLEWYQTPEFANFIQILSIIILIVVTIYTLGTATTFATGLLDIATNLAISYAIKEIVALIDNPLLKVLVAITLSTVSGQIDTEAILAGSLPDIALLATEASKTYMNAKTEIGLKKINKDLEQYNILITKKEMNDTVAMLQNNGYLADSVSTDPLRVLTASTIYTHLKDNGYEDYNTFMNRTKSLPLLLPMISVGDIIDATMIK